MDVFCCFFFCKCEDVTLPRAVPCGGIFLIKYIKCSAKVEVCIYMCKTKTQYFFLVDPTFHNTLFWVFCLKWPFPG